MANNPDTRPNEGCTIPVSDSLHAPFIFYEIVPALGHTNGIINLTLSANRTYVGQDGVIINEQVVVACVGTFKQPFSCGAQSITHCCWRPDARRQL